MKVDEHGCSFPHVAGLRWAYNPSPIPVWADAAEEDVQPADTRVVSIEVLNAAGSWEALAVEDEVSISFHYLF